MGRQGSFFQIGSNMACFIESENNSTKGILNLLEFSHVVFIQSIRLLIIEFASRAAVSTLRNLQMDLKFLRW